MNQQIFAADYGTLPHRFFSTGNLTNPTELIQSRELTALLYLCGVGEAELGDRASDYEKFKALCRSFPLLDGHPLKGQITAFLKKHFQGLPEPSPSTCDLLWRQISDQLSHSPKKGTDFLPKKEISWLSDTLHLPLELPKNISPILDCHLFLDSKATSYADFQEEICAAFSAFLKAGSKSVLFRLDRAFRFVQPSVYHVECALRSKKRTREQTDILTAQILREISVLCNEKNVPLRLLLECEGEECLSLLRYADRSTGLPALFWSAADRRGSEAMLSFASRPHQNEMRWALHCGYLASPAERSFALQFAAARYPVGRLTLVSGADLRYIDAVQDHYGQILEKSL